LQHADLEELKTLLVIMFKEAGTKIVQPEVRGAHHGAKGP